MHTHEKKTKPQPPPQPRMRHTYGHTSSNAASVACLPIAATTYAHTVLTGVEKRDFFVIATVRDSRPPAQLCHACTHAHVRIKRPPDLYLSTGDNHCSSLLAAVAAAAAASASYFCYDDSLLLTESERVL